MNWIINRFKEPSTWRGLIVVVGIAGVKMAPELRDAICQAGIALISLVEIIRKEKDSKATVPGQAFNPNADILRATRP